MTNQNVVVSDVKSSIKMTKITPLFLPAAADGSGSGDDRYFPGSRKDIPKKQESSGGRSMISSMWVESMRASSPSRTNSDENQDQQSLAIVKQPSALVMFEDIMKDSKEKKIVVFLDYDGTLSPIVQDPDRAFMTNEMREAVRNVANYFPTAIVSGRCRAKLYGFVRLPQLYYAGSHGMDIQGPTKIGKGRKCTKMTKNGNQAVLFQPAKEFLPIMDEVYKALVDKTKTTPGAKVENNKFCLSVHFRCVHEKRWVELQEQVRSVIKDYPKLRLSQGRKVLEIRPTIKWDKGKALEFLLESLGYSNSNDVLPIYIGDDRTDEDAFKVLRKRGQGCGIIVSKCQKETYASYSLQEPSQVMHFLRRLVAWRQSLQQASNDVNEKYM